MVSTDGQLSHTRSSTVGASDGGPHVEVHHSGVGDHAAGDQVVDQLVVLGGRRQPARRGRSSASAATPRCAHSSSRCRSRRPRTANSRSARAGSAGTATLDGDRDGLVAIVDADVHLGTADQLFAREQLVVGQHPAIPRGRRDLHLGGHRQRNRAGSHDADAELATRRRPAPRAGLQIWRAARRGCRPRRCSSRLTQRCSSAT